MTKNQYKQMIAKIEDSFEEIYKFKESIQLLFVDIDASQDANFPMEEMIEFETILRRISNSIPMALKHEYCNYDVEINASEIYYL